MTRERHERASPRQQEILRNIAVLCSAPRFFKDMDAATRERVTAAEGFLGGLSGPAADYAALQVIGRLREASKMSGDSLRLSKALSVSQSRRVLPAMMDWLGRSEFVESGDLSQEAFSVISSMLRDPKKAPAVLAELRRARNDDEHPYREGDAVTLIGCHMCAKKSYDPKDVDALLACLDSPDDLARSTAIGALSLSVNGAVNDGRIIVVEPLLARVVPAVLSACVKYPARSSSLPSFTLASSLIAFESMATKIQDVRDPERREMMWDALVNPLIKAGTSDPKLENDAIILLAKVMAPQAGDLPKVLARKLMFEGRSNNIVASALVNLSNPPINEMLARTKSVNAAELLAIGLVLANIDERALDPVIAFCAQDDKVAFLKGVTLLGLFANEVNKGASDPEKQKELARIERKLRGPEVGEILKQADSSGDEQVRTQVKLFKQLMKLV